MLMPIAPVEDDAVPAGGATGLTAAMLAVLDAVASDKRFAWIDRSELVGPAVAPATGEATPADARPRHDPATVDALVASGWLTVWRVERDEIVTLTPGGAERLRVEIVEDGVADRPRWGRHLPPPTKAGVEEVAPSPLPSWPDLPVARKTFVVQRFNAEVRLPEGLPVVDPAPDPLEQLLMAEAVNPETGEVERDEATGGPILAAVLLWGQPIPVKTRKPKGAGGRAKLSEKGPRAAKARAKRRKPGR